MGINLVERVFRECSDFRERNLDRQKFGLVISRPQQSLQRQISARWRCQAKKIQRRDKPGQVIAASFQ
ncbi:hypothetical protein QTP88_006391 [Uroleucon formosanum]